MIRVNLGRGELKKGKKKSSLVVPAIKFDPKALLLIVTASAFALLPYLFVVQYRSFVVAEIDKKMTDLQEKISGMKNEVAKFRNYKAEMESFEQQKKIVSERLALVRQLLTNRNAPVGILDAVSQSLSQRTWLSALEFGLSPDPQLKLMGHAYSNEDVSDFLDKLSDSIYLQEVKLQGVDAQMGGSGGTDKGDRSFQIVATPRGVAATAARSTASGQSGQVATNPGQPEQSGEKN